MPYSRPSTLMAHRGPPSKFHRFLAFVVLKKCTIFTLLLFNLLFFVLMYATASPDQTTGSRKQPRISRRQIDANDFHEASNVDGPDSNGVDSDLANRFRDTYTDHKPCSNLLKPPEGLGDKHQWYSIAEGVRTTFVFSAYHDTRTNPDLLKIFGISSGSAEIGHLSYYCQVWYRNQTTPYVVPARFDIVPETHDYKYAPAIYICNLRNPIAPYAVSLVTKRCDQPVHVLPVQTKQNNSPKHSFTVCVSPLNFRYDDVYRFVENIEINRVFGAEKIVFYNHSTGGRLDQYLHKYIQDGVVDVIDWKIPVGVHTKPQDPLVQPEIHYFGQVIALNDCLYRYMHRTKYIVFTDLDEVLVPRSRVSWNEMMQVFPRRRIAELADAWQDSERQIYGSYLIRNTFFRIDWPDNTNMTQKIDSELRLRTQLKIVREERIWDYFSRTKCIVAPQTVESMGIHFVFGFINNLKYIQKEVSERIALLHHYRDWGEEETPVEQTLDPYLLKFRDRLHSSVIDIHNKVGLIHVNS